MTTMKATKKPAIRTKKPAIRTKKPAIRTKKPAIRTKRLPRLVSRRSPITLQKLFRRKLPEN
jgi:hypothetical protein